MWTAVLLLCSAGVHSKEYQLTVSDTCTRQDTETIWSEFTTLYVWLLICFLFFFGLLISMVRDVVPRPPRGEPGPRHLSGESSNVCLFVLEEYLLTGWFIPKPTKRFSNTARWCILFSNIYIELLAVGVFYKEDYRKSMDFGKYQKRDYAYAIFATLLAFGNYLVAYLLLVNAKEESDISERIRHALGYMYVGAVVAVCSAFTIYFTDEIRSQHDKNNEDMVRFWLFGFLLALAFEFIISENIRLFGRVFLLWAQRSTNVRLKEVEVNSMVDDSLAQRKTAPKTFSFSEG